MSALSGPMLKLGGFLLAHASWIIDDLGPADNYVPQALCLKEGELELNSFEADTQEEAVARGKAFMEVKAAEYDACAFARDGLLRHDGRAIDALIIDLADETGAHVLTMIQPYRRDEQMHLLGDEVFLFPPDRAKDEDGSAALRPLVRAGAQDHSGARETWNRLDGSRQPAPDLF